MFADISLYFSGNFINIARCLQPIARRALLRSK
jgi:hypothetical protein